MFDPSIGRWLTEDPLMFEAGDPNLYRYVGNDAPNAEDPSGLVLVIQGSDKPVKPEDVQDPGLLAWVPEADRAFGKQYMLQLISSKKQYVYTVSQLVFEIKLEHFASKLRHVIISNIETVRNSCTFAPLGKVALTKSPKWKPTKDDRGIQFSGDDASVALTDLLKATSDTQLDCFSALYLIHLLAIKDVITPQVFDKHFTSITINGEGSTDSVGWLKPRTPLPPLAVALPESRTVPGNWRYFRNPRAKSIPGGTAWIGENVIEVGIKDDRYVYYGFGGEEGYLDYEGWIKLLNKKGDGNTKNAAPHLIPGVSRPVDYQKLMMLK